MADRPPDGGTRATVLLRPEGPGRNSVLGRRVPPAPVRLPGDVVRDRLPDGQTRRPGAGSGRTFPAPLELVSEKPDGMYPGMILQYRLRQGGSDVVVPGEEASPGVSGSMRGAGGRERCSGPSGT